MAFRAPKNTPPALQLRLNQLEFQIQSAPSLDADHPNLACLAKATESLQKCAAIIVREFKRSSNADMGRVIAALDDLLAVHTKLVTAFIATAASVPMAVDPTPPAAARSKPGPKPKSAAK